MPRLSVIIPVYNAEEYIEQCVESVLNQSFKDIEIIIIDDGSTDKTGAILDDLSSKHDTITLVHQNNMGLYKTRKRGLEIATGEFIGFVDADDYIEKNMYEILIREALDNDSELVYCDYKWFPRKPRKKEKWFRQYNGTRSVDFVERNSQPWNKIVKKELLEKLSIGDYFETCFDEIYIYLLLKARNPVSINKELYHYRIVDNSMSSDYKNINHYKRFVESSINLQTLMKNDEICNNYWSQYFEYRIIYYLLTVMIVSAYSDNIIEYKSARQMLKERYPRYKDNIHFWGVLRKNFGFMKAMVIGEIVPINYMAARGVCLIGMR